MSLITWQPVTEPPIRSIFSQNGISQLYAYITVGLENPMEIYVAVCNDFQKNYTF